MSIKVAVGAALAAVALAGCSASSTGSSGSSAAPSSAASSSATSSSSAPTTQPATPSTSGTSSSASTGAPSSTPRSSVGAASAGCANGQLKITAGRPDGATGHDGYVLLFRNTSSRTCTLYGYPGFDALRSGHPPVHAKRTLYGFMGGSKHGLPTVHVRPGHSASARVEYTSLDRQHPSGNCPTTNRVAVTAANTTRSVTLDAPATICTLEIHPTVPGTSGDDN